MRTPNTIEMHTHFTLNLVYTLVTGSISIYCRVSAMQGLRRNALAPGRDETRASDPLVRQ